MSNEFLIKIIEQYKVPCDMFLYLLKATKDMPQKEKEDWILNYLLEVNR